MARPAQTKDKDQTTDKDPGPIAEGPTDSTGDRPMVNALTQRKMARPNANDFAQWSQLLRPTANGPI